MSRASATHVGELIGSLSIRDRAPQIEYAQGDGLPVLVLRNLDPVPEDDLAKLREFAAANAVQWYLQPKGPETAAPLPGEQHTLGYRLDEFGLRYPFSPTEFTQVNPHINEMLVRRAIRWLDIQSTDRIGDFFCGLGNFTLPIAQRAAFTYGVEGSAGLVTRAKASAAVNHLSERVGYEVANLFEIDHAWLLKLPPLNKWLVDPPRDGALALVKALPDKDTTDAAQTAFAGPDRIVYVSCNPATLARDASILVHEKGYTLDSAGVANMFPHTAHVESLAVFSRR
jgi:23S rRNA (uracil1939-C5)-methyltransferase